MLRIEILANIVTPYPDINHHVYVNDQLVIGASEHTEVQRMAACYWLTAHGATPRDLSALGFFEMEIRAARFPLIVNQTNLDCNVLFDPATFMGAQ